MKPVLELSLGMWHMMKGTIAFGNPVEGGFAHMSEALFQVELLNKKLKADGLPELAASSHLFHEMVLASDDLVGDVDQYNSPRAITIEHWIKGMKKGIYPKIGRIIPPGFALPWSDRGALIHPDKEIRQFHINGLAKSFVLSRMVKDAGGKGEVIYWTGPDGIRWRRLTGGQDVRLSYKLNPELEEWKLIIGGIVEAVKIAEKMGFNDELLLIEGKAAGDPCYLDTFTDQTLTVMAINEINEKVGRRVAVWQPESAHERGSGKTMAEAMKEVYPQGVSENQIHLNAGGLAPVVFSDLLAKPEGTMASEFPQYVDNDFLPREGPPEWVEDQVNTIEIGTKHSSETGKTFQVEFDARFSREKDTIGALEKSTRWVVEQFNKAVAKITT